MPRKRSAGIPCPTGKRKFPDRVSALLALADTLARSDGRRNEVRAYHCPKCRRWHLTSKAVYERPSLQRYAKGEKLPYAKPRLTGERLPENRSSGHAESARHPGR